MDLKILKRLAYAALYWRGNHYLTICSIVKDENEYLEEWIRYHLKIGVTQIYLYDNGSKMPVKHLIKKLKLTRHVTVINFPGATKQLQAYKNCIKRYSYSAKWIAFIDADEFLVPKSTLGNMPAILEAFEPYGALGINWQLFGSSGHKIRTGKPVLDNFIRKAEIGFHINKHVKCIVQPKKVRSVLNPHEFVYIDNYECVNENFVTVSNGFSDPSINKVQLNHYYCKSYEEFEAKIERGFSDRLSTRTISMFHHHDEGANELADTTALEISRAAS